MDCSSPNQRRLTRTSRFELFKRISMFVYVLKTSVQVRFLGIPRRMRVREPEGFIQKERAREKSVWQNVPEDPFIFFFSNVHQKRGYRDGITTVARAQDPREFFFSFVLSRRSVGLFLRRRRRFLCNRINCFVFGGSGGNNAVASVVRRSGQVGLGRF